jgi:hypothetical protein
MNENHLRETEREGREKREKEREKNGQTHRHSLVKSVLYIYIYKTYIYKTYIYI